MEHDLCAHVYACVQSLLTHITSPREAFAQKRALCFLDSGEWGRGLRRNELDLGALMQLHTQQHSATCPFPNNPTSNPNWNTGTNTKEDPRQQVRCNFLSLKSAAFGYTSTPLGSLYATPQDTGLCTFSLSKEP